MLTCIACTKHLDSNNGGSSHVKQSEDGVIDTPRSKQVTKSLTSQIKDMAVKASGAYKNCKPCSRASNRNQNGVYVDSDAGSDSGRFKYGYQRAGSVKDWGKEMESRLKGLSSEEGTPISMSSRTESVVFMDEETKEWVAQVEPGVLITFVSLSQGGNDLKRIRFSREMFNKWEAQRWWAENFEKVMELYNVQQSEPVPTPPVSEDGVSKINSAKDSPVTPPLDKERPRNNIPGKTRTGHSSSDSLDHQPTPTPKCYDSAAGLASTPKLSSISGAKTETSSINGSVRSSSIDRSEEVSVSNASDMEENEWVEQDEPGIYITIRALPDGNRELRRVRFSRDKFGETHARLWWEQNRGRIQQQYL